MKPKLESPARPYPEPTLTFSSFKIYVCLVRFEGFTAMTEVYCLVVYDVMYSSNVSEEFAVFIIIADA
jgi:hypothetical protein